MVFCDTLDEQVFLAARQQVRREWRLLRRDPGAEPVAAAVGAPPFDHQTPIGKESSNSAGHPWRKNIPRLYLSRDWSVPGGEYTTGRHNSSVPDKLEAAAIARQEDLLVYFALSYFKRRRAYSKLPGRLQRDARFFFGGAAKARAVGRRALFAVADRARVLDDTLFCHHELGIGKLKRAARPDVSLLSPR